MATGQKNDSLDPARRAWRRMLLLHARMHEQVERDAAAAGVVPLTWFDVLATLAGSPGHSLRLRDLADAVLLSRAGLTRVLDRVEAEGLVSRQSCADDGRGSMAVLTAAGVAAFRRARPIFFRTIDERFAAHVSPAVADALGTAAYQVLAANQWLPEQQPVTVNVPVRKAKQ